MSGLFDFITFMMILSVAVNIGRKMPRPKTGIAIDIVLGVTVVTAIVYFAQHERRAQCEAEENHTMRDLCRVI